MPRISDIKKSYAGIRVSIKKSNRKSTANLIGFVDAARGGIISGWVKSELTSDEFIVTINGLVQKVSPKFFARKDLIEKGIDGVGFEAHFNVPEPSYDIHLEVCRADRRFLIPFSETKKQKMHVADGNQDVVILDLARFSQIAGSINADTETYLELVKDFGKHLAGSGTIFDVLFIDGTRWSVSTRYRILNVADGLRELGYTTLLARTDETSAETIKSIRARVIVFFRAPYDDVNSDLLSHFRTKGARIVFDIDDLVFDENIVSRVDGVRFLTTEMMDQYLVGVEAYRRLMLDADHVTASTPFLAQYIESKYGCSTSVVRNTIGKGYLDTNKLFDWPRQGDLKQFIIGYYSGSKTHQNDFMVAAPAIIRFMHQHTNVILRVVGKIDLDEFEDLQSLRGRIIEIGMMQYYEMINDITNCDVIIAPLVIGDPYCESKSELKFFEAALKSRPCICSSTEVFQAASKAGVLAKLAKTEQEWFNSLTELLNSPAERRSLAKMAHAFCLDTYSYKRAGEDAAKAYFGHPCEMALPAPISRAPVRGKGKSIGVLVPDIIVGAGGHRKILGFCKFLADNGFRVTLYVDSQLHPTKIRHIITEHYYEFECEIINLRGVIGVHDVVICTHWTTAYNMSASLDRDRTIYFIQDYEPMFDAVGTRYVKAAATYQLGYKLVCYGRWVADRIDREFSLPSEVIDFTLDRNIYKPDPKKPKSIDVLFFARPSQPRRCFELGVEALRDLWKNNKAVRIGLYGEEDYGELGFTYHNFGLVTDTHELASIYNRSRVGICFSTTNPSLVGYEMLACGLPVLDIRVPGFEVNFNGDDFIFYANAHRLSIRSVLAAALNNEYELEERAKRGTEFVQRMHGDDYVGIKMMEVIEQILNKQEI